MSPAPIPTRSGSSKGELASMFPLNSLLPCQIVLLLPIITTTFQPTLY
uniref:Uncharacterized protein n=1 Tax=Arundo donax TaxID=35708 RepID=A0A0A9GXG5_ARUDO